jgi:hypothetical protein
VRRYCSKKETRVAGPEVIGDICLDDYKDKWGEAVDFNAKREEKKRERENDKNKRKPIEEEKKKTIKEMLKAGSREERMRCSDYLDWLSTVTPEEFEEQWEPDYDSLTKEEKRKTGRPLIMEVAVSALKSKAVVDVSDIKYGKRELKAMKKEKAREERERVETEEYMNKLVREARKEREECNKKYNEELERIRLEEIAIMNKYKKKDVKIVIKKSRESPRRKERGVLSDSEL